jgi:uncharacterized membrane protein
MLTQANTKSKPLISSRRFFGNGTNKELFKQRGHEITRIEALSDSVFAFSISLLIMSVEVPQTFKELKHILQSFLPFVATVSLVFLFWYHQNRFFRHYGINDVTIISLNAALLVMVLFYVYPLKFLFSLLFNMIMHVDFFPKATMNHEVVVTPAEFPQLVIVYSAGYAAIWLVFYLMYRHAWQSRKELALTTYEAEDTLHQLRGALINVIIGVGGICFAWLAFPGLAALCFAFIPLTMSANKLYFKKQLLKKGVLNAQL